MATPTKYRHPVAINRDGMAQIGPSRFQLRGIRLVEGEEGAATTPPATPPAPTPPAPAAPAAPATPQPPAQSTPPATPPAPPADPQPPVNYRGNPDEYVRELREEAKTHRLAAEKATTDLTTAQTERDTAAAQNQTLARENFVLRNASKFGVNPDAALDSNSFMTAFKDVDLSKDDDVKAAFETALEKNSALKAGSSLPGTSGGGHQGGQPTSTPITLDGAVKAALSS